MSFFSLCFSNENITGLNINSAPNSFFTLKDSSLYILLLQIMLSFTRRQGNHALKLPRRLAHVQFRSNRDNTYRFSFLVHRTRKYLVLNLVLDIERFRPNYRTQILSKTDFRYRHKLDVRYLE